MQAFQREQVTQLREHIPMWDDNHAKAVGATLLDYGVTEEEIQSTYDARIIRLVHDLNETKRELADLKAANDKAAEAGKKAARRVKKTVPKMAKVEKPMSSGVKLKLAKAKLFKRVQDNPDDEAAHAALFAGIMPD